MLEFWGKSPFDGLQNDHRAVVDFWTRRRMHDHVNPRWIEGQPLQRSTDDLKERLLLLRWILQPGLRECSTDAGVQYLNGVDQRSEGLIAHP